ncbi:MAG: hypothetical protein C5B57_11615 [Blastocatellia bacterium]|nr:MAG: hypothetical protein C5B57_11615 [Blastocatellia bacterium]
MRTSPFRLAAILFSIAFGVWVVFATLVVPHLIESVYEGSLPFLSTLMLRHRLERGTVILLDAYLSDWRERAAGLTADILLFGVIGLVIVKALESRPFFEKFVGNARSGMLGAIRMWTCSILLVSTSLERIDTIALMPREMLRPMGLMTLIGRLPGFDHFLASGPALWAFQWITVILLLLGTLGWRTRLVIPLAAIAAYVVNGILREFSFFWHQNLVPIYVLAVLSFTPCGDGWSLDRLRRIYKGQPVPDAEQAVPLYGWSRYACWVPMALLYCWSGLSKLRQSGIMWVNPTNMRNILYEESLSGRWFPVGQGLRIAWAPDVAFVLLGLVAISGEITYPSVLFSKRARRILPLVTMGMHVGIILLQDIVFLDLIALNLILLDFTWLREAIGRRLARRGALKILYDGTCEYCRRSVRLLKAMDLFGQLELINFRELDLTAFNDENGCTLNAGDLEREMALLNRGRVRSGFFAYRTLSSALPPLWPLAPILRLPGVSRIGAWVYRQFAVKRHGHPRCSESCATDPVSTPVFAVLELTGAQRWAYVYGLTALALVMIVVFSHKIEFYPLTSMQLFTGLKPTTVIYYRVIGERVSGARSNVRLEDGIAAMRFNGRYSPAIEGCFGEPAEKEICRKFLNANLAAYNSKSRPEDQLNSYEVDKVVWDFELSPQDPLYGRIADRFTVMVNASEKGRHVASGP